MMEKHKIVLVPFPFDDFSELKVRPAVCLTNSIGKHKHVVIAFITSKAPEELEKTDVVLDQSHTHFVQTGLKVSSTIRLHRLVTIGSLFIQRELGRLPEDVKSLVDQKMKQLFGGMIFSAGQVALVRPRTARTFLRFSSHDADAHRDGAVLPTKNRFTPKKKSHPLFGLE